MSNALAVAPTNGYWADLRRNGRCICGKHMLEFANEGTCLACGHGPAFYTSMDQAWKRLQASAPLDGRAVPAVTALSNAPSHVWDEDSAVAAYRAWERDHDRAPKTTDWVKPKEPGEHRPSYQTIHKLFGGWKGFTRYIADVPREQVA